MLKNSSPSRGGRGASSRAGLEMGGWFRPLPGGTRQARKWGGPKDVQCSGAFDAWESARRVWTDLLTMNVQMHPHSPRAVYCRR